MIDKNTTHGLYSAPMARGNIADQGRPGYLYLIEMPGNRIKIGFAEDVEQRLEGGKVYTWIPDIKICAQWKVRANWEPHIREFATDNIDDLELIPGRSGTRSEVFKFVGLDAFQDTLVVVQRRITQWIELYSSVYPLTDNEQETKNES